MSARPTRPPSRIVLAAVLALGLARGGRGADQPGPDAAAPVHGSATLGVVSAQIFRGERLAGQSLQPAVEIAAGRWTVGAWSNLGAAHLGSGRGAAEADVYAYAALPLAGGLSLLPGLTDYNYPSRPTMAGGVRQALEPNLALSFSAGGFRFTPELYYDFARHARTADLTVAFAYPLPALGTELDLSGQVGRTAAGRAAVTGATVVERSRGYGSAGVAAPYQLGRWRATLGFQYAAGFSASIRETGISPRADPAAAGRGVVSLSLSRQW